MAESLVLRATLAGHANWVTSIAAPVAVQDPHAPPPPAMFVSASRDRSLMLWKVVDTSDAYAVPERSLRGHSHFVQDVVLSNDSKFALTGSWDGTLRLWNLDEGSCAKTFTGHSKDVLSVAFNALNTKIVSGGRDRTILLWNVLGECKYKTEEAHNDWVSCVRFSPKADDEVLVSAGWDKIVKVWDVSSFHVRSNLIGHTGYLNTVTVSPDGSLCASGGKDGIAMLWDLTEGKRLYTLPAGSTIHSLVFSPTRYWLCAATDKDITIWDLESKSVVQNLVPDFGPRGKRALKHYATSLCWSADGATLYSGYTDNQIRVWSVASS